MTNRRLSSLFTTVLLCLLLFVPVCSWILVAMGLEVHSILCAEGFRWLCMNVMQMLAPSWLLPILAFTVGLGCIQSSGIVGIWRRERKTVGERIGFIAFTSVLLILLAAFLVPVFKSDSELRSVTGHLFPSPWLTGAPFALSVIVFLSSLSFCLFARKEPFVRLTAQLLSAGFSRQAGWLVNLSLLNLLIELIRYILP